MTNDILNQKNNSLAPVVVFVYKRLQHTENVLKSLAGCKLATDTEVFIFSDGPKKSTDEEEVAKVRKLINEDRWKEAFRSVTVNESPVNKGLANSIISGATQIINKYGKVLVLEDDLIVAPYYLTYMNQALQAFEDNKNIYAVAGWSYPVKVLESYNKDAWLHYRPCSWGWGTWADRWNKVVWDHKEADFAGKLEDAEWCKKLAKAGNDLAPMLRRQLKGEIDSWAIRWTANQTEQGLMAVFPTHPVVYDDGRDGSGTHCHASGENENINNGSNSDGRSLEEFIAQNFVHGKDVYDFSNITVNKKIINAAWNYDSDTFVKKVKRNLKKIFKK